MVKICGDLPNMMVFNGLAGNWKSIPPVRGDTNGHETRVAISMVVGMAGDRDNQTMNGLFKVDQWNNRWICWESWQREYSDNGILEVLLSSRTWTPTWNPYFVGNFPVFHIWCHVEGKMCKHSAQCNVAAQGLKGRKLNLQTLKTAQTHTFWSRIFVDATDVVYTILYSRLAAANVTS